MDDTSARTTPSVMARVRNLGNWANLSTPLGLAIARAGGSRVLRGPRGLTMAEGYRLPFPMAGAFTVGSVVITSHPTWADAEAQWPGTLEHEEHHTWQWTFCLGAPFLPLYTAAMAWSWLRTGDRASANAFERAADLRLGGYTDRAKRPLREGWRQARTLLFERGRSPRGRSGVSDQS
ncbi:hypothetical protein ACSDQ9_09460 [Aestuariimicrobium soli]|uniref:hypothetical protein n=1 Tax=Aestuariimicrobium soli TaxID=2035834 RepID=UPI003EB819DE